MATRISLESMRRLDLIRSKMPVVPARPKYGNKKVVGFGLDGEQIKFDSKREAKRWSELVIRLKAGEICELQRQVTFRFEIGGQELRYKPRKTLGREVTYKADFTYRMADTSALVVEDAKGLRTDTYKLKWALMKVCNGIEVREV